MSLPSSPISKKHQASLSPTKSRQNLTAATTAAQGDPTASDPSAASPTLLKELKGVSLEGIGQLEHNPHDYEMFLQSSEKSESEDPALISKKLSRGLHHDQILQSYDILFP
jgi:hypothetical protein